MTEESNKKFYYIRSKSWPVDDSWYVINGDLQGGVLLGYDRFFHNGNLSLMYHVSTCDGNNFKYTNTDMVVVCEIPEEML